MVVVFQNAVVGFEMRVLVETVVVVRERERKQFGRSINEWTKMLQKLLVGEDSAIPENLGDKNMILDD